jgi:hypothetical protein
VNEDEVRAIYQSAIEFAFVDLTGDLEWRVKRR